MSQQINARLAVVGIDIGKKLVPHCWSGRQGEIVLPRQKWSRSQVEAGFANMSPCLIGMEACVGAHHIHITDVRSAYSTLTENCRWRAVMKPACSSEFRNR